MNKNKKKLSGYSTYIFDLDGCIHFGNTVAEGAPELLALLHSANKQVFFLSNNSTHSPASVSNKLSKIGITATADSIYLASSLTGRYILENHGKSTLCVAGTNDLTSELQLYGHTTVLPESSCAADIFVLGRDLQFDFVRLKACANRILNGAAFYACNADLAHPSIDGGCEPETGALAAALTAMTGVEPKTFGKPTQYAYQCIMNDFALSGSDCLMIGDNALTDIKGALAANMDACWLMLTKKTETMPKGTTHAFPTIKALFEAIQKS